MTAEPRPVEDLVPRDVEEIAALVRRVQALPTAAAELVAREFVEARLAAADREKAELRGRVDHWRQVAAEWSAVAEERNSQLAAAQAQLAEANSDFAKVFGKAVDANNRANAAEARLEAVRALHFTRGRNILGKPVCNECLPLQPMPCPTLRALDAVLSAAPQPEPERQAFVEQIAGLPEGRRAEIFEPPASDEPARCGCARCDNARRAGESFPESLCRFMIVCATCGNKRCPRAAWHGNECTGSNEPGQPGSNYPAVRWADMFGIAPDSDGPTEADR